MNIEQPDKLTSINELPGWKRLQLAVAAIPNSNSRFPSKRVGGMIYLANKKPAYINSDAGQRELKRRAMNRRNKA